MRVRIAYNADHPERIFFPPPPPQTRPELLDAMPFPTCGILGIPDLMHHKYVVRDGESVWTGSMNWTTDSWTLQENVVVTAEGAPSSPRSSRRTSRSCGASATWTRPHQDPRRWRLRPRDACLVHAGPRRGALAPDRPGDRPCARARADRVAGDHGRAVLGTLAEVTAERRVDLRGVVDHTQMDQVVYQWRTNGHSAWKVPILASVLANADFKGKLSTSGRRRRPTTSCTRR